MPADIDTPQDRVIFIKSVASFMASFHFLLLCLWHCIVDLHLTDNLFFRQAGDILVHIISMFRPCFYIFLIFLGPISLVGWVGGWTLSLGEFSHYATFGSFGSNIDSHRWRSTSTVTHWGTVVILMSTLDDT